MIAMRQGALYIGRVMHVRLNPIFHRFKYRVFSIWLDIDRIAETARGLKLFSYNRFGLVSFFDRDHGARDGAPLRNWVENALQSSGISPPGGAIRLFCLPRILGHVFNPLSIYFCYDRAERLSAMIYEVRNTFGEIHAYVAEAVAGENGEIAQSAAKSFYVSPLLGMDARYDFSLRAPGRKFAVTIRESGAEGPLLVASHWAKRVPLSDRQLLKAFLTHPLLTLKVVGAIHFEALRLFLKGARYNAYRPHSGPPIERAVATAARREAI